MNRVRMGWDAAWGRELAELMAHPAGEPSIRSFVVCMTLFNEPAGFVSGTLQTLAHNLMDLAIEHEPWAPPLLCIMADGGQHLSADTLQLLDHLGVPSVEQPAGHTAGRITVDVTMVRTQVGSILQACNTGCSGWTETGLHTTVDLMVCVKDQNAGKLDSHALFFRNILPQVNARFVLQVDAGSRLLPDCLRLLCAYMDRTPDCAALAPRIQVQAPRANTCLFAIWQYHDFLLNSLSLFALGDCIGYLEVLPGQCSLFRRSSILPDPNAAPDAILARYFNVGKSDSLLAHTASITEDRLIGSDLVLESTFDVSLNACLDARVETDRCERVDDLCRQRRRWSNGSIACRILMLGRLKSYSVARHLPPRRRWLICCAFVWGAFDCLLQYLLPVMCALSAGFAWSALAQFFGADAFIWATTGSGLFLLQWLGVLRVHTTKPEKRVLGTTHNVLLAALCVQISLGFVALIWLASPMYLATWLFALLMGCVGIGVLQAPRSWREGYQLGIYLASCVAIDLYLTTYAFTHVADVSWGTKGLVAQREAPSLGGRRLERAMVGLWVALTFGIATVVYQALSLDSIASLMRVVVLVSLMKVIIGAARVLLSRWPVRTPANAPS